MKRLRTCPHCNTKFYRKNTPLVGSCCSRDCRIRGTTKVDPITGCWNWTGGTTWVGYGQFSWDGYIGPAHRHSYLEFNGPIDVGLVVRHKCDNKLCCNPAHLEVGTQSENLQDRFTRRADTFPLSKTLVMAIFAAPGKLDEVAEQFGVSSATVCNIRRGKSYAAWTGKKWTRRKAATRKPGQPIQTLTVGLTTKRIKEWAEQTGIPDSTIRYRIRAGLDPARIIDPAALKGGRRKL